MPTYLNKIHCRKIVEFEKKFRFPIERQVSIWEPRYNALEQFGWDTAKSIMITNADGIEGNHKRLSQLLKESKYTDLQSIKNRMDCLKQNIQTSKWKQKFYTYAFNGDKENCIKYQKKLDERAEEDMEEMNENNDTVGVFIDNTLKDDKKPFVGKNEGGYKEFCDLMSHEYKTRKSIMKAMF